MTLRTKIELEHREDFIWCIGSHLSKIRYWLAISPRETTTANIENLRALVRKESARIEDWNEDTWGIKIRSNSSKPQKTKSP